MNQYIVVAGTTGALATFQNAVVAYVDQGFTPMGGVFISGTDIYQAVAKDVDVSVGVYAITAVDDGVNGSFSIATNQTQNFHPGFKFQVVDSTGNDRIYTVAPAGSTFSVATTVIPVVEEIPDATVDGSIIGTT